MWCRERQRSTSRQYWLSMTIKMNKWINESVEGIDEQRWCIFYCINTWCWKTSLVTCSFQHLGYFSSSSCFKIFSPVLCGQSQDWGASREERHKVTNYFPKSNISRVWHYFWMGYTEAMHQNILFQVKWIKQKEQSWELSLLTIPLPKCVRYIPVESLYWHGLLTLLMARLLVMRHQPWNLPASRIMSSN